MSEAHLNQDRPVIDEQPATFFDYAHKLHLTLLPETGEALWMSERSGWNHLYRIDLATGAVRNALTIGEWVVRAVDEVDVERRTVRFRAVGVHPDQDPYYVHHGRVELVNYLGESIQYVCTVGGAERIIASVPIAAARDVPLGTGTAIAVSWRTENCLLIEDASRVDGDDA